jgi:hypothetical protein
MASRPQVGGKMEVLPSFPALPSDQNEIEENLTRGVQLRLSEIQFHWGAGGNKSIGGHCMTQFAECHSEHKPVSLLQSVPNQGPI